MAPTTAYPNSSNSEESPIASSSILFEGHGDLQAAKSALSMLAAVGFFCVAHFLPEGGSNGTLSCS